MPEVILRQVLERLRREVLSQSDYALLAAALAKGEAVASGAARWRILSVFPADFDAAAAAAVWEIGSADDATDALNTLEARGLVEAISEDRYRLHDLLRDLARQDCPKEQAEEAALRHAQHFVNVLATADGLFQKGGEALQQSLALVDRERTNIMAGQRCAAAGIEGSTEAAQLAARYADDGLFALSLRLRPLEWIRWGEAALAANRTTGNRLGECVVLASLGRSYARLGEIRTAIEYHELSLAVSRELGDQVSAGATLGNLGAAFAALGDTTTAIGYYEHSLSIARLISDRRSEANALGNLGLACARLGEPWKALRYHQAHYDIAREIGDRAGQGNALGNLGNAYADLSQTRRALFYLEQQLIITREIGDKHGEGNALANLGRTVVKDNPGSALGYWREALAVYTAIEDPRAQVIASSIARLGDAMGTSGR